MVDFMWNEAAARSAAQKVIEKLDGAPCDNKAVADCARCSALYLARRTLAMLAAAPTPSEAVKCADCNGDGYNFLAGRPASRENVVPCDTCTPQADPAPSVARFDPWIGRDGLPCADEGTEGEFIRYTDHARIVAEKDAEIATRREDYATLSSLWHLDEAKYRARAEAAEARADALAGVLRECASWLGCAGVPRDLRLRIAAQLSEGRP